MQTNSSPTSTTIRLVSAVIIVCLTVSIKISLKSNIMIFFQWPERIYHSPHGVTAVDFSIGTPNLLAVGYHNGTIAIYNVQSKSNVPVLDSR
jgi:WD40 repeat protein